jgi:uncharacterized protein (UPF0548 family)
MFLFSKPNAKMIDEFIDSCSDSAFSYEDVGVTKPEKAEFVLRPQYTIDHNRINIGNGSSDFERAKEAIRQWRMFDFDWLELCWPTTPIEEGRVVAILIQHFGVYSLNAAKIVYSIDAPIRFGFAYGTLAEHGESGEERFSVEFDEETGDVTYDLFAFSKPNHFLSRLGYPLVRRLQKEFGKDSKAAMLRAIQA